MNHERSQVRFEVESEITVYEAPPISMKFRQFHDEKSSSFKSMKLVKGNHDSFALFRLRARLGDLASEDLCGEQDVMNASSSSSIAMVEAM